MWILPPEEQENSIKKVASSEITNISAVTTGSMGKMAIELSKPKVSPGDLAEAIKGTEAGATIMILSKNLGNVQFITNKFFLTGMQFSMKEKAQLLESFGAANVSFFGETARIYNFLGITTDYAGQTYPAQYFYQSSLLKLYEDQLRGTKLLEKGNIAVMRVVNHLIYGYPLNMSVQYDAGQDKLASFSMSWLVVDHSLELPGVVTNSDLQYMYSTLDNKKQSPERKLLEQLHTDINNVLHITVNDFPVDTLTFYNSKMVTDHEDKFIEVLKNMVEILKTSIESIINFYGQLPLTFAVILGSSINIFLTDMINSISGSLKNKHDTNIMQQSLMKINSLGNVVSAFLLHMK